MYILNQLLSLSGSLLTPTTIFHRFSQQTNNNDGSPLSIRVGTQKTVNNDDANQSNSNIDNEPDVSANTARQDQEITGTAYDDTIYSGSGNDTVYGGFGNDKLFGQNGDDILRGQADDDLLVGGRGNDDLRGDAHDDRLYGGHGHDQLVGGSHDDYLNGGNGNDVIYGDTLTNNSHGKDILIGGNGNDYLEGQWGRDKLYGGRGDDILVADESDYVVTGDDGFDILKVDDWNRDDIVDVDLTKTSMGRGDIEAIILDQSLDTSLTINLNQIEKRPMDDGNILSENINAFFAIGVDEITVEASCLWYTTNWWEIFNRGDLIAEKTDITGSTEDSYLELLGVEESVDLYSYKFSENCWFGSEVTIITDTDAMAISDQFGDQIEIA